MFTLASARLRIALLAFVLFLGCDHGFAQNGWLVFSSVEPPAITVCGPPANFTLTLSNVSASPVTGILVSVDMPPGMQYVPGSVSGTGVAQHDVSNLNIPVFSVPNLAASGGSVTLNYQATAGCAIIPFINGGSEATMAVTANYTGGFDNYTSPDWNVVFPSISVVSVSNQSFNGNVGNSFSRTITLTNAGNGPLHTPFLLRDVSGAGLAITGSVPAGVLSGGNYDVSIPTFTAFGDGDALWEPGENISITITYNILNCSALGTSYQFRWGCGGSDCQLGSSSGNVVIQPNLPNLLLTPFNNHTSCFNIATPDFDSLRIVNTGLGAAANLTLDVYLSTGGFFNNALLTQIDTGSIRIFNRRTGVITDPAIITVQTSWMMDSAGPRMCLRSDAFANVGRFRINIGTVAPNDTLFLTFRTHSCCFQTCNGTEWNIGGWQFEGTFQSQCLTSTFNIFRTAGRAHNFFNIGQNTTTFAPTDVAPNGTAAPDGCISVEVNDNDMRAGASTNAGSNPWVSPTILSAGGYLEWIITLPTSLTLSPGTVTWTDPNGLNWIPAPGYPLATGPNTFAVRFLLPQTAGLPPVSFTMFGSAFRYCVEAICGTSGPGTIINNLNFVPNASCACVLPQLCRNITVNVNCPTACPNGMEFNRFAYWRSTLGRADYAPQDGLPDAIAVPDTSQFRLDRAILGDTLSQFFAGVVRGASFARGFAASTHSEGQRMARLDANVRIWDASAGIYRTAALTAAQIDSVSLGGSVRRFWVTFSPQRLNALFPGQFPQPLENGDSVWVRLRFRVNANNANGIWNDTISTTGTNNNGFYVSNVGTATSTVEPTLVADRLQCGTWGGRMTITGLNLFNMSNEFQLISACTNVVLEQSIGMNTGFGGSGANFFQREFRVLSYLDSVSLAVPPGYTFQSANIRLTRGVTTGTTVNTATIPLTPVSIVAGSVRFKPLAQYVAPIGTGTFPIPDETYSIRIQSTFTPSCAAATGQSLFRWCGFQLFVPSLQIPGAPPNNPGCGTTADTVFYNKPDLNLTAVLPTVEGIDSFISWDVILQNIAIGSTAHNTFLALQPTPTIQVQSVTDLSTSTVLTPVGGIYQIGNLNSGASRSYRIRARYTSCARDSVFVLAGWNCGGYPPNIAGYSPCVADTFKLVLLPQVPELVVGIVSAPTSADLCDVVTYEVQVSNVQPGTSFNNIFAMIAPPGGGLFVVPGSAQVLYPLSATYAPLPNPTQFGSVFFWNVSNAVPTMLANGLRGVREPALNTYRVRFQARSNCNINSGSRPRFFATGSRGCSGSISNFITAPPYIINGAANNYNAAVSAVSIDTLRPCAGNPNIRVRIVNLGPAATGANDTYQFSIDQAASFQAGSFVGIHNAPTTGTPASAVVAGSRLLTWTLPAGVPAGDSVIFSFRINGQSLACGNQEFISTTSVSSSLTCVQTGLPCQVRVNTASATDSMFVNKPELDYTGINVIWNYNSSVNVHFMFNNVRDSAYAGSGTVFNLHIDSDSNGVVSPGDIFLGSIPYTDSLNPGGPYTASGTFPYTGPIPNPRFVLQAAPPASPCLCDTAVAPQTSLSVLPVELLEFTATLNPEGVVDLEWYTATEVNSAYFEVERSPDGSLFAPVGMHRAAGNSSSPLRYALQDQAPLPGLSYYRLRMVDLDGRTDYSDLRSIWIDAASGLSARVYPNPTRGTLSVQIDGNPVPGTQPDFWLHSPTGQRIRPTVVPNGQGLWQLHLGALPTGFYTLHFVLEGRQVVHKVVVE